jgi:hypothetical protein
MVGSGDVGHEPALAKAWMGKLVLPAITRSGPMEAWIIDGTGFPKKGWHSVGVTRQYCGHGKTGQLSDCGEPVAGQA